MYVGFGNTKPQTQTEVELGVNFASQLQIY